MQERIAELSKVTGLSRVDVRKIWEKAKVDSAPRGRKVKKGTAHHMNNAVSLFNQRVQPHIDSFSLKKAAAESVPADAPVFELNTAHEDEQEHDHE